MSTTNGIIASRPSSAPDCIAPIFRWRRFLTLSYGERRLVLLARTLAWAPKLLLLDEIFNGLDAPNRERVQHCLRSLSRSSLPWVLTSHRPEDIPAQATHLCRLEAGRITLQARLSARARRGLGMPVVAIPPAPVLWRWEFATALAGGRIAGTRCDAPAGRIRRRRCAHRPAPRLGLA